MTATRAIIRFTVSLAVAPALFAQLDSYQLRAKYGQPLARETFTIAPDFEMIADYGPDQQVCRLELPVRGNQQQVDDILLALVPDSMRGKNQGSMFEQMGVISAKITDYEHVTISEPQDANRPGQTSVTVSFKRDACRDR